MPIHTFPGGTTMKIGLTLLCKNEIDIIEAWLRYHIDGRFDEVIIADNVSSDGTWEKLLTLRPSVLLKQIKSQTYKQAEWVYEMDVELRNRGCEYIVNLDADEFLSGDVRAACTQAAGVHQLYPVGTFMRATAIDDCTIANPVERIQYHDSWNIKYSNDKAVVRAEGLSALCQGNHWGYWGEDAQSILAPDLRLYHYEQRSAQQLIKKYGGHHSAEKLANMGAGWRAMNELWSVGGNQALLDYWQQHCLYDPKELQRR
jgi:hypothetical protein